MTEIQEIVFIGMIKFTTVVEVPIGRVAAIIRLPIVVAGFLITIETNVLGSPERSLIKRWDSISKYCKDD